MGFRSAASSAAWTGPPKAGIHLDNLIEFESRVNDVWRRHDDAVSALTILAQFSGDTVIDIMRTHPVVIIGGILQQNPFFVRRSSFCPNFERVEREAGRASHGGLT